MRTTSSILALALVVTAAPLAAQATVELTQKPAEIESQGISTSASSSVEQTVELGGGTSASGGVVFQLPGEYLVSGYSNNNWRYTMRFDGEQTFRKIVIDFDFVMGRRGPGTDENYDWGNLYYSIFWLNNGSSWDNMIAYPNLRSSDHLWNETNAGGYWNPDYGEYGLQEQVPCHLSEGGQYHIYFIYDTVDRYLEMKISQGSSVVCNLGSENGIDQIDTTWMFIEFGTSYAAEGPEGWTLGWRYSNFKIQFLGSEPIPPAGRLPRRR